MNRVAAIDCGTNSVRLLIADPQTDGTLTDVVREMRIVRLGEGVDDTGRLSAAAIDRTLRALAHYGELIRAHQPQSVRFVATSAMRDASNGEDVIEAVSELLGVKPETISGANEASLSFRGAISSFRTPPALPTMIVDIGGGSTELVTGTEDVDTAISVNMGSVRVTERFNTQPGDHRATAAARTWIDAQLDEAEEVVDFSSVRSVVGVAGTVTTVAAKALGLTEYAPDQSHGQFLTWNRWQDAITFMVEATIDEKASLRYMPPGRADVIGAGALIWERILARVRKRTKQAGAELTGAYVSEHDVLDGIALSIAGRNC